MQNIHLTPAAHRPLATIAALVALLVQGVATAADPNPDPARAARLKALAADQENMRQTIAGLQPTDAALDSISKKTAETDKPLLAAALAARKKAIEAGNAHLALLVPETDPVEIEVRGDEWVRSQNELELATLALALAHDRTAIAARKGTEQAAAAVRMSDVLKRDEGRLAARKALLEANLRLRIAERKRRVAEREFEEALRKP
jgi:hypothetical protein